MGLLSLTSENFDKEISTGRIIVDFWAEWCMPCRMVAPILDELAEDYKGRVTVAKVNIDNENALAVRYEIMGIPTVILFNEGVEVKRFIGVQTKEIYEKELKTTDI